MDNAFLGPIISALGRSFQSKRNRGKSTGKKNIHRMGFLLLAAYGFWAVSLVALVLFLYFYFRFNRFDGICQGILMSCPVAGLLFYVWYRNAYVEITRTYVLQRTFLRFVERLNIVVFVILDTMSGRIVTIILKMDYILMVPIMMKDILMKG